VGEDYSDFELGIVWFSSELDALQIRQVAYLEEFDVSTPIPPFREFVGRVVTGVDKKLQVDLSRDFRELGKPENGRRSSGLSEPIRGPRNPNPIGHVQFKRIAFTDGEEDQFRVNSSTLGEVVHAQRWIYLAIVADMSLLADSHNCDVQHSNRPFQLWGYRIRLHPV